MSGKNTKCDTQRARGPWRVLYIDLVALSYLMWYKKPTRELIIFLSSPLASSSSSSLYTNLTYVQSKAYRRECISHLVATYMPQSLWLCFEFVHKMHICRNALKRPNIYSNIIISPLYPHIPTLPFYTAQVVEKGVLAVETQLDLLFHLETRQPRWKLDPNAAPRQLLPRCVRLILPLPASSTAVWRQGVPTIKAMEAEVEERVPHPRRTAQHHWYQVLTVNLSLSILYIIWQPSNVHLVELIISFILPPSLTW